MQLIVGPGSSLARMPRRWLLGGLAASAFVGAQVSPARATSLPPDTTFRVLRKGTDIGRHTLAFRAEAVGFRVEVDVDLAVKVAFVTAFRYRQQGRDRWQDDLLVESRYATDDDGKKSSLVAGVDRDGFVVDGSSGRHTLPLGTMTDLCFWNEDIIRAPSVVDSQTGEATRLETRGGMKVQLPVAGQQTRATRYVVQAHNGRAGSVWYDASGRWVGAEFTTRGEHLTYELI